jgi:hypothetical protein
MWYNINGTMLHQVDTIVAAIGPAGVAFHTHHIVAIFHNTNVNSAHPSIANASFFDAPYCALISINGNKPTNNVMQLAPSQGIDSSTADTIDSATFVLIENCRLN